MVLKEEQLVKVGAHAELGREDLDLVEGNVEVSKLAKLTDGGRERLQAVGGDEEVVEELVAEEGGGEVSKSLATEVHVVPVLPFLLCFQAVRPSPVIRLVITVVLARGGRRPGDTTVLGSL